MNAPLDDKALDEYLTRGSDVSRRYRELDGDTVPPELDRRVLAEARAAASKNQSGGRAWMRWSAPVALAASAVLVLSIVIEGGVEQKETLVRPQTAADARPAKAEVSTPQAAAKESAPVEVFTGMVPDATFEPQAPPQAPAPAPARSRDQALARQTEERSLRGMLQSEADTEEVTVTGSRPAAVTMESPSAVVELSMPDSQSAAEPNADESAIQEAVVTAQRRSEQSRDAGSRDMIDRGSVSNVGASAEAERIDYAFKKNRTDPERWLEEIRQLRRDRKVREADVEWEQFRKEFPDYPVAAEDIAIKRP